MEKFLDHYWQLRLTSVSENLQKNNFSTTIVQSAQEARMFVLESILPDAQPRLVAFGGSMTFHATGLMDDLQQMDGLQLLSPYAPGISDEEKIELRRQGLLADLYLTGANAITASGKLVNLDMIGNRIAALTFGPKKVVVLAGRNKIVPDLEAGMARIKEYAAPTNAMRLDCQTPCVKTGECADCKSPGRICNTWTITEKSFPKGRVTVVLINQDLGL